MAKKRLTQIAYNVSYSLAATTLLYFVWLYAQDLLFWLVFAVTMGLYALGLHVLITRAEQATQRCTIASEDASTIGATQAAGEPLALTMSESTIQGVPTLQPVTSSIA